MDWIGRMNEVTQYVEENLENSITADTAARLAGCSEDQFLMVFSYLAEQSFRDYVRNRRLTQAAFDLLKGEGRILDLALKYGYESQDAFSRAFRTYHGILPSKVRKGGAFLQSCPRLTFTLQMEGGKNMNYQVEERPAFTVLGSVHPIKTEEAFMKVPDIWACAWKDGTMGKLNEWYSGLKPEGYLGIAVGGKWGESDSMDYILGVTVDEENMKSRSEAPEGLEKRFYPSSTWVILKADGELPQAIQEKYREFYREWLPQSGFRLADLPVIECYLAEKKQEIWIAVEK